MTSTVQIYAVSGERQHMLSYNLVTWAEYHGAMRTLSRGHRDFTVTMDTSGHPRELLKVIERIQWDLRKHAQRWKELL